MPSSHNGLPEGMPQQISSPAYPVDVIEQRLLRLTKQAATGVLLPREFIVEASLLVKDLRRCFRQVVEMKDRRDLSFKAFQELQSAEAFCVWLYRKIHAEEAFFKKVHLETRLRGMVSVDAFAVHQELLDTHGQERDFLGKADADISRQLLGDSPSAE